MESIIVLKAGNTELKLTFSKKPKQNGLGKFPNFHTKKICINKEVDDAVCFCHKKEAKKVWCHKKLSPFVPKCPFVLSRAGLSIGQAPRAEVCGKVALHL